MEIYIDNEYLTCLYQGSKPRIKPRYQKYVVTKFIKTVNILRAAPNVRALFKFNSLYYEKLGADKSGLSSVRVTDQYRIEFREIPNSGNTVDKLIIKDLSNHYKKTS